MFWPTLLLILDLYILFLWEKRRRRRGGKLEWYWAVIGPTNIIVLSCMTIIMLIATAYFIDETFPINQKRTETEIKEIAAATSKYIKDTDRLPESIDEVIGKNPIRKSWKTDYWDSEYQFIKTDSTLELVSAGSDTVIGTKDDIRIGVPFPKEIPVARIPFTLTSHNNISIKAMLNGKDIVSLMFHTAASDISLTTLATQRLKSVLWEDENEVNSWGGSATSRISPNNSLIIGALHWDSLTLWENERSGPGTDGKFGPSLFEGKVIEINFDNHELIIRSAIPSQLDGYAKSPLHFEDGFMFIDGTSTIAKDEYPNRFLIHSGYGGTILLDDSTAAASRIGERIAIMSEKELRDSFGNVIKTKKGMLPGFSVGSFRFEHMPVGFFEGAIGRQQMSVLGGDLLKRFNVIIDANREFIYLQPNGNTNDPFADF